MSDADANAISDRIHDRHLVYGFIHETKFKTAHSTEIQWTDGNGDAALWTGFYLAAEAFRFKVTGDRKAWNYLRRALDSVHALSFVAPGRFLARTMFPGNSVFIDHLRKTEGRHGLFPTTYPGYDAYWVGEPTRDQYCGAFLGLGVTYDLVDDAEIRSLCRDTITHLVEMLSAHHWFMGNPDHPLKESYVYRPDHLLSTLQLARHVNPERFGSGYRQIRFLYSALAGVPAQIDLRMLRKKYYMLNLDYSYAYNLIRLEDVPRYQRRYRNEFAVLRKATASHGNAHFNMIDRAVNGPDPARDRETVALLDALLRRGFRDNVPDQHGHYKECGPDESCDPIPVDKRPYADFLWQRSPFDMKAPGDGSEESPGIDYVLPYWMARYYGVL